MKGGVLIIGSLFWDIHQNKHQNVRLNWRNNHLQMNNRIHVRVPIWYGRTSGKDEKKVYTMVFSAVLLANQWGTAYVVPFKLETYNYTDVYHQAKYLSYAEGADDTHVVKGDNKWCVIGILFNPKFDAAQKLAILNQYEQQLEAENLGDVYSRFCIAPEPSILSKLGEIMIPWPLATNTKIQPALDKLDFIIATCPRQNIAAYPDATAIKALVSRDERDYFYNNVANGITTYQDREILEA
ncbi:MAG: hypothetical protein SFU20_04190 [Chitinophagaceae bacterium]|nr:hypothetical protein [Chitinophagaceae bacterium]